MNKALVLVCAAILFVLVVVAVILYRYPLEQFIDTAAIGNFFEGLGALSAFGFIAAGALFTAFGLPRQLIAFIGGYTYGVTFGVFLGTVAAVMGATLTFYFARWLARPFVARKYPKQVALVDAFVRENFFLKIITLRFLPFGTNLATNLAAGATDVSIRPFALASFIGFIPQMAIFALSGQGVSVGSTTQIIVAGVLFLISLAIGGYIYQQRRATSPDSTGFN